MRRISHIAYKERFLLKKLLSALICLFVLVSALPGAAENYTVEDAYNEALVLYPAFFTKIKSQFVKVNDADLLAFVDSVYDYLKENESELDCDDFDSASMDAVLYASSLRQNISVRNAFALAYPEVVTDGLTGEPAEVFSFLASSFAEHGLIAFTPFINAAEVSVSEGVASLSAEFRNLPEGSVLIAAFYDSDGALVKSVAISEKGQTVSSAGASCKLIALYISALQPVCGAVYVEF